MASKNKPLKEMMGALDERKPANPPQPQSSESQAVAPSRQGKKAITGYFDPAASKQLKQMAIEQDSSIQALLGEAINDLFKKHGKPHIA